jgi:Ran GTPase-activating protein (RanGAP) involved in mRNA processing and transport
MKKKFKKTRIDLLINEVIKQDTKRIKALKEINNTLFSSQNKYDNTNPYIFSGLVESIFVNESDNSKQNIYGCGILIESDIVIVSSNNLILRIDDENISTTYSLYELNFYLFNVSSQYQDYLPYKLKVKDYYTPISNDENLTQEERLLNAWGIVLLEYPIGEYLKFVLEEKILSNKFYVSKKNIDVSYPKINCVKESELEAVDLRFLHFGCDETKEHDLQLGVKSLFDFKVNRYPFLVDENFFIMIFNFQQSSIFEGPIVYKDNFGVYNVTGINSNFEYKENEDDPSKIFALRFSKNTTRDINEAINSLRAKHETCPFNKHVFKHITQKITDLKKYYYYLKDNCKFLEEELFNEIKENSRYFQYKDEEEIVSIYHPFMKFCLFLISNKIFKNCGDYIDLNNFNFGLNGCEILSEIMKNLESFRILNLRSNSIYAEGMKMILKPVLNTPFFNKLCQSLMVLNIDNNKLGSKGVKYLTCLLKNSISLESLSLNNNNMLSKGVKYLYHSLKCSSNLSSLSLNYNNIDSQGCDYLVSIIRSHESLKELFLESNNLCDEGGIKLFKTLKEFSKLQQLSIAYNSLTGNTASSIGEYLFGNESLISLNLSNNDFSENFVEISYSLSENSQLKELNLDSSKLSNEGLEKLCSKLKENQTLNRLYLNSNEITDENIINIVDLISNSSTITHLFLSNNYITNEGAKLLAQEIINHKSLIHLKLNSNYISDEGGDLMLFAIYNNSSIRKFNIENNFTSWRENKIDIKNLRENLEILY